MYYIPEIGILLFFILLVLTSLAAVSTGIRGFLVVLRKLKKRLNL
jgi:hypothetical protein